MRVVLVLVALWLAAVMRCEEPTPAPPPREPLPGEAVKIRGTLTEDVDCRLLRADGGKLYSLSSPLRGWVNGSKVCIHGTLAEVSQCLTQPMIEVQAVRPLSACP